MTDEQQVENEIIEQNQPLQGDDADKKVPSKKLLYLAVGLLALSAIAAGVFAYYRYRSQQQPTPPPTVERRTPLTKESEVRKKEEEVVPVPPAEPSAESPVEDILGDLEEELQTLDQIDEELNTPEIDLDLSL